MIKDIRYTITVVFISCLVLLLCGCNSNTTDHSQITLIDDDLSVWQEDAGEWFVCGSASMDQNDEQRISTSPGTGVLVNGRDGNTKDILTLKEYGDVQAHVEFMVPKGSNSGIYFMGRYEIQVLDSWGKDSVTFNDAGGIYERWDENRQPKGYEGERPRLNASKKAGEWQEFDIIFQAPRFNENSQKIANAKFVKVSLNGKIIHENVQVSGPTRAATFEHHAERSTGPLMLQGDHGPVAYRNIRITELE